MFDARKLLDTLVGAAAQFGQPGRQPAQPSAGGETAPGQPQARPQAQGGSANIADQVDQTLRQVTGQGTGELVQKAKDVLGFEATTSLETMLDEVIPWIEQAMQDGRI